MSEPITALLEKVSSYNLFNYLFTGAVFLIGLDRVAGTHCLSWALTAFVLVAYFIGMVLSRIGSLIIEPIFKKVRLITYADYPDFVKAEKADSKIAPLLEGNNTYRTLTALFAALCVVKIVVVLRAKYAFMSGLIEWAWPVALMLLFAFSYMKQTKYIAQRVETNINAPK